MYVPVEKIGDFNGDGTINISDVTALLYYLASSSTDDLAYDISGDGLVNITDVTTLLYILAMA